MRRAVLMTILIAACGGDDAGGPDAAGEIDAPPAVCSCAANEGCLAITVTRTADVSAQPWTVWPTEADGVGTLIASASDGAPVARVTVPGANMVPATASYRIDLGCVPVGTLILRVFLDDNLNAGPTDTFSSDYRDSCLLDRAPAHVIAAGAHNEVPLALNNSCD